MPEVHGMRDRKAKFKGVCPECGVIRAVRAGRQDMLCKSCTGIANIKPSNDAGIHLIHGYSKHPVRSLHQQMINRCYKEDHQAYKWYGAKGIKVCAQWHDLSCFAGWMFGSGYLPNEGWSIDRKDSTGDYSPDNCEVIPHVENVRRGAVERWRKHRENE